MVMIHLVNATLWKALHWELTGIALPFPFGNSIKSTGILGDLFPFVGAFIYWK